MYTYKVIYNKKAKKPFRATIKLSKNLHNLSLEERQCWMWDAVSMHCVDYGWKKELFEIEENE